MSDAQTAVCNIPPDSNGGRNPGGPGGLGPGGGGECGTGTDPAATLESIDVEPTPGFCENGGRWQFSAIAHFSDGSCLDVTSSCQWLSSTPYIATVDQTGLATAIAAGIATISASYGGQTGYGTLDVASPCHDIGLDVVLVIPRDGGMLLTENGLTRLFYVERGAAGLIGALDAGTDQAAIISYSGVELSGSPTTTTAEYTLDSGLTNNAAALLASLQSYDVRGPCLFPDPNFGPNSRCAIGLGAPMYAALEVVTGPGSINDSRKLVVLILDGRNRVSVPDPAAAADAIKAAGVNLMVIGIGLSQDYANTIGGYATTGLFFNVDAKDLPAILATVANTLCGGFYPYGYSGIFNPYSNPYLPPPPNPGDPDHIAGNLQGLRWELPCITHLGPTGQFGSLTCSCAAKAIVGQTRLNGDSGTTYDLTLRFRGVIECNPYYIEGTSVVEPGFYTGGGLWGPHPYPWNVYSLIISPPGAEGEIAQSYLPNKGQTYQTKWYWLNRRADVVRLSDILVAIDYTVTIQARGGSLVTLYCNAVDGGEVQNGGEGANWPHLVVPDIAPSPDYFDGQFIQMDVVSVV